MWNMATITGISKSDFHGNTPTSSNKEVNQTSLFMLKYTYKTLFIPCVSPAKLERRRQITWACRRAILDFVKSINYLLATHLRRQTGGAQRRTHSQIQCPKTKIPLSGFNRQLLLITIRRQTWLIQTGRFCYWQSEFAQWGEKTETL